MIQRIQSFYLLLVILLSASLSYGFFVTEYAVKLASLFFESFGFFAILILAIISLLLYTKRKLQILFCLFLILLNLIHVIIYGYMIFNGSNDSLCCCQHFINRNTVFDFGSSSDFKRRKTSSFDRSYSIKHRANLIRLPQDF